MLSTLKAKLIADESSKLIELLTIIITPVQATQALFRNWIIWNKLSAFYVPKALVSVQMCSDYFDISYDQLFL